MPGRSMMMMPQSRQSFKEWSNIVNMSGDFHAHQCLSLSLYQQPSSQVSTIRMGFSTSLSEPSCPAGESASRAASVARPRSCRPWWAGAGGDDRAPWRPWCGGRRLCDGDRQ